MADRPRMPGATGTEVGAEASLDEAPLLALSDIASALRHDWRRLFAFTFCAGALGAAGSYLLTPEFTSTVTFLPPQQQQSSAASALASLGALAGLAGGAVKSPAEQYVSLMQSVTVGDRMIDRFELLKVYDKKYRRDARKSLADHTEILVGKKDGIIGVAVDDVDPKRAAAMANQYVDELRRMTSLLAVSEAQQRRVFFEGQMRETQAKLIDAQAALQKSGFDAGALNTEPRSAADQYARIKAEATATEVKIQGLRSSRAENSPEIRQQQGTLDALRSQLARLEDTTKSSGDSSPDYINRYREFKYQDTLFGLMARQYELARIDESREGALIQVIDPALPAELKSKPRRALMAIGFALVGAALSAAWIIRRWLRRDP